MLPLGDTFCHPYTSTATLSATLTLHRAHQPHANTHTYTHTHTHTHTHTFTHARAHIHTQITLVSPLRVLTCALFFGHLVFRSPTMNALQPSLKGLARSQNVFSYYRMCSLTIECFLLHIQEPNDECSPWDSQCRPPRSSRKCPRSYAELNHLVYLSYV